MAEAGQPQGRGGKRPGAGRPKRAEQRESVTKKVMTMMDRTLGEFRRVGITEPLVKEMALQGLATLYLSSRKGSEKASMYLVDRLLGTPDKPFAAAAQQMDEAEVRERLTGILTDGGLNPELAAAVVGLLQQGQKTLPEPNAPIDVPYVVDWAADLELDNFADEEEAAGEE